MTTSYIVSVLALAANPLVAQTLMYALEFRLKQFQFYFEIDHVTEAVNIHRHTRVSVYVCEVVSRPG